MIILLVTARLNGKTGPFFKQDMIFGRNHYLENIRDELDYLDEFWSIILTKGMTLITFFDGFRAKTPPYQLEPLSKDMYL